jgi:hypothetical protein
MDEFILPSAFLIVFGSLIAIIGTQMAGKARRSTRQATTPFALEGLLGRGKAVAAAGWFVFLLGFLGLLAARLV